MTALLVILTFVVLVSLDYTITARRTRAEVAARSAARRAPLPITAARDAIPRGIFLQPTLTWSRLGEWGEVYLGVHPMLVGMFGAPLEVEFRALGAQIAAGEPLVRLGTHGRRVTVRSPVSGRVERVHRPTLGAAGGWTGREADNGAWLYRIAPDRISDDMASWLSGEPAVQWSRRRYEELRRYLTDAVTHDQLGVVMADGGELPVGILAEMGEEVWKGLDDQLAASASPEGAAPRPEIQP